MVLDSNLTISRKQLEKLVECAQQVIKSHSENTLVDCWDSVRIQSLLNAIKSVRKSTGIGGIPTFDVQMMDCEEWMEKEFWSDAALAAPRDKEIEINFTRIKRFSPDPIAVLCPTDHHTIDFEFFEYGDGRIAYYCDNDGGVYPSLSKISKEELIKKLASFQ